MTSWAVVADVWYLEPQEMRDDEDPIKFANRVRRLICDQAGIKPVPWDGMLKYYRPSPRMCEKRRAEIAASFESLLDGKKTK
jgi:glycerol-3-phosphate O-acyltransferase 3/4